LPAGRILNVLPVTREFSRDKSSLVGYCLLITVGNTPSIQQRFAVYLGISTTFPWIRCFGLFTIIV